LAGELGVFVPPPPAGALPVSPPQPTVVQTNAAMTNRARSFFTGTILSGSENQNLRPTPRANCKASLEHSHKAGGAKCNKCH
jgi:hypothetical protein